MDTNKMRDISREQFEAKFPVPSGVAWKESIGMYEVVDIWKLDKPMTIGRYNWLWEGWQASREAVSIQFPDMKSEQYWEQFKDVEGESFIFSKYLGHLTAAIKAQGLKVAP
ncbi:hypothetical protein [Pseudomonas sp. 1121_17]|uniref:hypothetical protein n=1 Tax=Pseudomonas sp. 1121_17 TaxID=2604458 RepID=UPI004062E6E2